MGKSAASQMLPTVADAGIVELPKIVDPRGALTFVESRHQLPFDLKRAYWLYDVPGGESRGGHAHRQMEQVIVAVSGSLSVRVSDGDTDKEFFLNRSYYGVYIPRMIWRELHNFSSGSVCLALVSTVYDEADYVRSFEQFRKARR